MKTKNNQSEITNRQPVRSPMMLTMLALGLASGGAGVAAGNESETNAGTAALLKLMSVEDLMNVTVTSVSKKSERLNQVPAAVSVISGDDIRRSGALTLPEALRLAPGVQVARVDAAQTAVSVRGFNDTFSQKLLVMMDGRSIYTPLFSGTIWQAQDMMLEDVDRIEVIRGPGGTVWGANAVNGVINIVSKPARETQGVLLSGGGGTEHLALAGVRYGAQLAPNTFFRIYGKYDDWNNFQLVDGGDANDAWWKGQGGFRLDWEPSSANRLTLQGDLFGLEADQTAPQISLPVFMQPPPATGYNFTRPSTWEQSGGNVLARWSHQFSEDSDLSVQTYYDHGRIDMALIEEKRDTFDLDLRHRFQLGGWNEVVWGGGYRLSEAVMTESVEVNLSHESRSDKIYNVFVQDEIKLIPDRLRLTLGSKVEHNDYTGFELEPGARLSWTPSDKQTVWASVARAVRTPSQFETDAAVNMGVVPPNPMSPLPTLVSVIGNPDIKAETLIAYELGYRIQAHQRLTFDVTLFLNDYDELRSTSTSVDMSHVPSYVQARNVFYNQAGGQTYGGEMATTWQATDWWRLYGQLSVLETDLHEPANGFARGSGDVNISTPKYQASLRSSMDLSRQVEFDLWLRYVDGFTSATASVPGLSRVDVNIPSYVTFDARLAWRPIEDLELALVGQNLAGSHREFNPTFVSTSVTEVSRSVYAKLTWRF